MLNLFKRGEYQSLTSCFLKGIGYKGSALENLKKIFNYIIFSPTSLSLFHKIVFASSILLTVMFWAYSTNLMEEKLKLQFIKQSDELVETILGRLPHYWTLDKPVPSSPFMASDI